MRAQGPGSTAAASAAGGRETGGTGGAADVMTQDDEGPVLQPNTHAGMASTPRPQTHYYTTTGLAGVAARTRALEARRKVLERVAGAPVTREVQAALVQDGPASRHGSAITDMASLLASIGLERWSATFKEEELDLELLSDMGVHLRASLKELGLPSADIDTLEAALAKRDVRVDASNRLGVESPG